MSGGRGGKDKGKGRYANRSGMGRLRRANIKSERRVTGLERLVDDDVALEAHDGFRRSSHTGESLLSKFNRLAKESSDAHGHPAEVCGFEGTLVLARTDDGIEHPCQVRRLLKKMLKGERSPLVIGDEVRINHSPEGDPIIEAILPRRNQLERADSHNKAIRHVFAANIDTLIIVAAMLDPELKTGLIDRYLVIAHANEVRPVIALNKCDLADPTEVANRYRELGYEVYTTAARDGQGNDETLRLGKDLSGTACVFAGQSGVGKSSLIKAIFPEETIRLGEVSAVQHKGRHTTTASRTYRLGNGTRLIDTPGIRECALTGMTAIDVALRYRDLAPLQSECRFPDCTHTHEPDCAVKAAVESGRIHPDRYASYRSIVETDLADE